MKIGVGPSRKEIELQVSSDGRIRLPIHFKSFIGMIEKTQTKKLELWSKVSPIGLHRFWYENREGTF